jgi:soluble epoxide hydrolase/lipid-phosphate phosphatase
MSIFSLPGWKTRTFNGTNYAYLHIKPVSPDKPTFLCLHGFGHGTNCYYYGRRSRCLLKVHCAGILSLRKIIPLLRSQGYGIIAPEMLGYGGTAKPTDVAAYSRLKIGDSLKVLLAAEELNTVIVLGHDWVSLGRCIHHCCGAAG